MRRPERTVDASGAETNQRRTSERTRSEEGLHTSACGIAVLAGRSPSAFPARARAAKIKISGAGGARAACATLVALRAVARTHPPNPVYIA